MDNCTWGIVTFPCIKISLTHNIFAPSHMLLCKAKNHPLHPLALRSLWTASLDEIELKIIGSILCCVHFRPNFGEAGSYFEIRRRGKTQTSVT